MRCLENRKGKDTLIKKPSCEVKTFKKREKRHYYKAWQGTKKTKNYEIYKKTNKEVKKVVRDAKSKAYDNPYNKLGTRERYLQACKK